MFLSKKIEYLTYNISKYPDNYGKVIEGRAFGIYLRFLIGV
jgi:hypothetical protein